MTLHKRPLQHIWSRVSGLLSVALLFAGLTACSSETSAVESSDAQPTWMQTSKTDDATVERALASKFAVRINLQTNRATLYKAGRALSQWNIASADVTGEFHDNIPQTTPMGVFAAEDMQMCPTWLPRAPKDPKTNKVAANEQERMAIIKNNPELFGPCGAKNPLGQYVIWFHGEYGIHGNAAEWILEISNPEQRRVSGGCIRNPNAKIKDVFHDVLDTYPALAGFKKSVLDLESLEVNSRKTITQSLANTDLKVVVGRWVADPQVASGDGNLPVPPPPPIPTVAAPKKTRCVVSSVESVRQIVPVYTKAPANFDNEHTFYSKGDVVTVTGDMASTQLVKVEKGLIDKKYLSNCQIQN